MRGAKAGPGCVVDGLMEEGSALSRSARGWKRSTGADHDRDMRMMLSMTPSMQLMALRQSCQSRFKLRDPCEIHPVAHALPQQCTFDR